MRFSIKLSGLFFILLIAGCGGGGDSTTSPVPPEPEPAPAPPPPPAPDPAPEPSLFERQVDAARLLNQASFGPSMETIDYVVEIGPEAWIDEQLATPQTSHLNYLVELQSQFPNEELWRAHRMEAWWNATLYGEDQLRQRVAYALSQIMVVSDRSIFSEDIWGQANYYDLLATHAFGNYRELIDAVTTSPIMGMYLSMLGNEKPDAARNIRPDENYARELMQLFTIGLVELNSDGSVVLDPQGQPVETYNQAVIEAYAHVFTGWNFNGTTENNWYDWRRNYDSLAPMTPVEAFHDKSSKQLLNGVTVPAGQSAADDLTMALDSLFMHDNVAPFMSEHLIKHLVTSNPSRAYIARISSVFTDNGQGVRGDLQAVVKAILLDEEARQPHAEQASIFGKLKEPIFKATHLWRAFNGTSPNDRIEFGFPDYFFNQAPLSSPSVFNFYLPDYSGSVELSEQGYVSPELQIMTETFVVRATNFLAYSALWGTESHRDPLKNEDVLVDYDDLLPLLEQPSELIDYLNLVLMGGGMSEAYQDALLDSYTLTESWEPEDQVANMVFLIMASPQFAVQR